MFIDIHCHLSSPLLVKDIDMIIRRAEDCGVEKMLSVGEDYEDNLRLLEIASKYPMILPGLGHHPDNPDISQAEKTIRLVEENHASLACIGEIGLDFFKIRDHGERDIQSGIFREFIALGIKYMLPLNIHSRSAGDQTIELLGGYEIKSGVNLHAFSGKGGKASIAAVKMGYFFSIPGSIFYSSQKQKLARLIPDERILLETDSPVMSPYQGQINYPHNLPLILERLAEIRKTEKSRLEDIIYNNSHEYLGKEKKSENS